MSTYLRCGDESYAPARLTLARIVPWALPILAAAGAWLAYAALVTRPLGASTLVAVGLDGPASARSALLVRSSTAERAYDYITVTGEAYNRSGAALHNVEAVVEFLDGAGHLLAVDSALAESTDIEPGASSAFRVQTHDVPGISSYRIRFRRLTGAPL